jgi:hypothetical protein
VRINGIASGLINSNARTKDDSLGLPDKTNQDMLKHESKYVPLNNKINEPS